MKTSLARSILAVTFAMVFALLSGAAAAQGVLNIYNWNDYIDEQTLKRFESGDRDQGPLRRLRFERGARCQAARRAQRLRPGGAVGLALPGPAGAGKALPEDRPRETAELPQSRCGADEAAGALRSRQPARHSVDVGHDRHRLQRGARAQDHAGRAGLFAAHAVRPGDRLEVQGVRRGRPGLADRCDSGGAHLSRTRSGQQEARTTSPRPATCS